MLLYRHPKEAKKNREKAGKIISKSLKYKVKVQWSHDYNNVLNKSGLVLFVI